jgi:WhiB family redox-sensing transcriptional regulator
MQSESFMDFAKCRTNDSSHIDFFADGYSASHYAVKFCQDCPVKEPCLRYSIENEIYHGIWGGVSQNKRKIMIKDFLKSNTSYRTNKWQRHCS